MLEFLILLPLLAGLAVFALPVRMGRVVLAATGLLHLQLTLLGWLRPAQIALPAFFAPTPAGMLVLLDLLVGVMIMGIILTNINRTFDDVDTAYLEQLKD